MDSNRFQPSLFSPKTAGGRLRSRSEPRQIQFNASNAPMSNSYLFPPSQSPQQFPSRNPHQFPSQSTQQILTQRFYQQKSIQKDNNHSNTPLTNPYEFPTVGPREFQNQHAPFPREMNHANMLSKNPSEFFNQIPHRHEVQHAPFRKNTNHAKTPKKNASKFSDRGPHRFQDQHAPFQKEIGHANKTLRNTSGFHRHGPHRFQDQHAPFQKEMIHAKTLSSKTSRYPIHMALGTDRNLRPGTGPANDTRRNFSDMSMPSNPSANRHVKNLQLSSPVAFRADEPIKKPPFHYFSANSEQSSDVAMRHINSNEMEHQLPMANSCRETPASIKRARHSSLTNHQSPHELSTEFEKYRADNTVVEIMEQGDTERARIRHRSKRSVEEQNEKMRKIRSDKLNFRPPISAKIESFYSENLAVYRSKDIFDGFHLPLVIISELEVCLEEQIIELCKAFDTVTITKSTLVSATTQNIKLKPTDKHFLSPSFSKVILDIISATLNLDKNQNKEKSRFLLIRSFPSGSERVGVLNWLRKLNVIDHEVLIKSMDVRYTKDMLCIDTTYKNIFYSPVIDLTSDNEVNLIDLTELNSTIEDSVGSSDENHVLNLNNHDVHNDSYENNANHAQKHYSRSIADDENNSSSDSSEDSVFKVKVVTPNRKKKKSKDFLTQEELDDIELCLENQMLIERIEERRKEVEINRKLWEVGRKNSNWGNLNGNPPLSLQNVAQETNSESQFGCSAEATCISQQNINRYEACEDSVMNDNENANEVRQEFFSSHTSDVAIPNSSAAIRPNIPMSSALRGQNAGINRTVPRPTWSRNGTQLYRNKTLNNVSTRTGFLTPFRNPQTGLNTCGVFENPQPLSATCEGHWSFRNIDAFTKPLVINNAISGEREQSRFCADRGSVYFARFGEAKIVDEILNPEEVEKIDKLTEEGIPGWKENFDSLTAALEDRQYKIERDSYVKDVLDGITDPQQLRAILQDISVISDLQDVYTAKMKEIGTHQDNSDTTLQQLTDNFNTNTDATHEILNISMSDNAAQVKLESLELDNKSQQESDQNENTRGDSISQDSQDKCNDPNEFVMIAESPKECNETSNYDDDIHSEEGFSSTEEVSPEENIRRIEISCRGIENDLNLQMNQIAKLKYELANVDDEIVEANAEVLKATLDIVRFRNMQETA